MTTARIRVVHYLNQFFGGVGGEDKANLGVQVIKGPVGPGRALQQQLGARGEVVATIVAGDNYYAENTETARQQVVRHVGELKPNVLVAGPAFNAGRYGMNCGDVSTAVSERLGIPAVTAMHPENPGAALYKQSTYILPTTDSPAQMGQIAGSLARFAIKLASGHELGPAAQEGYIPKGVRKIGIGDQPGWRRATDMLVARLHDRAFVSEVPLPSFEEVPPSAPVKVSRAKLAVVTTSGVAPKGNPDGFRFYDAVKWGKYSIEGLTSMTEREWEAMHGGYDTTQMNRNPNYSVPLDVLRELEDRGAIGSLLGWIYSTTGNVTTENNSKRMGEEIARDLRQEGVDAALLVST
ncbi:MAG: glycine/betaine/sarcosine/D-proline family reductase selenoprotein B [Chloroflexi bacterium]|nr:glycine/betaine/sarcosine/D-proline family reductase selenoprotein B [Chloroflexota bacterium]